MVKKQTRNDISHEPYVAAAAGAGILIIVLFAAVFSAGCLGGPDSGTPAGTTTAAPVPGKGTVAHAAASSGTPGELSYNVVMTAGYERGEAVVPDKGVIIRIIYRGGYAGTWVSGNGSGEIRDSGERIVVIENPGSNISADLLKLDNSARQQMAVEIWKDGVRKAANSTSLPYGEVMVGCGL